MLSIHKVTEPGTEAGIISTLFNEYATELNTALCFQNFDTELSDPLKKYGPPKGSLYLAYWKDEPAGCIALQPIKQEGVCEMKRLYTKPSYRKLGIGDELVKTILAEAARLGYNKMVLDSLRRLEPAIKLYEQHGFKKTKPYYFNPLSEVVYMAKDI